MTQYLRNIWYQAAWASEVAPGATLARTILDTPVVLYRDHAGHPAALRDRCPHRFAPLSSGTVSADALACPYHGLSFDRTGACVRNPHGPITTQMRVDSYPLVERHTALWIWMGDANAADPATIPDLSFIDETPETARIPMYLPTAADYRLIVDNIMDLSHADYLHASSLGGIMTDTKASHQVVGEKVIIVWDTRDCDPPPAFRMSLPPGSRADIWTQVTWQAPGVLVLGTAAKPAGEPRTSADEGYTLHNAVPETATSSHYFVCSTRPFLLDNDDFTRALGASLRHAFEHEDKPILELQQQRMGTKDLEELRPLLLSIDAGAVRVRRMLRAAIEREAAVGA